jgi:hypothetical protein
MVEVNPAIYSDLSRYRVVGGIIARMTMPLPLRFQADVTSDVVVVADPGYGTLRDFFVQDLGQSVAVVARARARLSSGDACEPWQARYRHHVLDYDGTAVRVRDPEDGSECAVHPSVLDACLAEYLQMIGEARAIYDSFQAPLPEPNPPATGPGPAVTMLALGGVSAPAWGWGLLQTSQAMLAEAAGLAPHPSRPRRRVGAARAPLAGRAVV